MLALDLKTQTHVKQCMGAGVDSTPRRLFSTGVAPGTFTPSIKKGRVVETDPGGIGDYGLRDLDL